MPLILFGKLFHRWGAALLKDLAPNVLHLVKGTSNMLTISADLRPSRVTPHSVMRSVRYFGASPYTHL